MAQTNEQYSQGLLSEPVKQVTASTYEADKGVINAKTDTVENRLNNIVSDDSVNMQRAAAQGKSYANSRGLLNSSMGAQATQAAMIDRALPIAQQDAEAYNRQRLENQAAENTARSTNVQLETNASTSNASNDVSLKNAALADTGATTRTAMGEAGATERTGMTEAGATERTVLGEAGATERTVLGEAGATQRTAMGEVGATERTKLTEAGATLRNQFSELAATGRQDLINQTEIQTTNAKIAADALLNNDKISAANKETFSASFNEMTRQNDVEITKIALDPDLKGSEKITLIAEQNARFVSNGTMLAELYGYPITFDSVFGDGLVVEGSQQNEGSGTGFVNVNTDWNKDIYDPYNTVATPTPSTDTRTNAQKEYDQMYADGHSCFTGDCITIMSDDSERRIDEVKAGDWIRGLDGTPNRVIGVEKVPVGGRKLWNLDGTTARFTGEHPFMLANGKWGSFDKVAMDRELSEDNLTVISTGKGNFRVVGDMATYDENTVTQIEQGDLGVDIHTNHIPLRAQITEEREAYVYTMFMSGNRTWNIEGIVISGLALTGENPRLIKLEEEEAA